MTSVGLFRDFLPAPQICKPFFQSTLGFQLSCKTNTRIPVLLLLKDFANGPLKFHQGEWLGQAGFALLLQVALGLVT